MRLIIDMRGLYILLLIPIFSFGQQPSNEDLMKSMNQWVFVSGGNPIDGFSRTAIRMSNEQEETTPMFMLNIKSTSETLKIKNSTGKSKNDRDDVSIDLKTTGSFNNIDEILMYFDNENIYYKVNFRKYNKNGLLWWNAVGNDDKAFISRFNFITKLIQKNKVSFRFKYRNGEQLNASFNLAGSSKAINQVVDLTNIKNENYGIDALRGIFALNNFVKKDDVYKYLGVYLNGKLDSIIRAYLNTKVSIYHTTFIYKYRFIPFSKSVKTFDINDDLVITIPYSYFNEDNRIRKEVLRNLSMMGNCPKSEECQKIFSNYSEFLKIEKNVRENMLYEIKKAIPDGVFKEDFTFEDYCRPLR